MGFKRRSPGKQGFQKQGKVLWLCFVAAVKSSGKWIFTGAEPDQPQAPKEELWKNKRNGGK